jgi:predicted amidohydrolase
MKEKVRVSLVQLAPEWLERGKNAERMKAFAEREAQEGAELIVFPELANIGYITPVMPGMPTAPEFGEGFDGFTRFGIKYVKAAEPIPGPTTEILGEVCRKRGVYIVVGIAQLHPIIPATLYNAAALIGPRGVIGIHHKMHLPNNEKLFFYPGSTCEVYSTDLGKIALTVCYDSRFELTRILALRGAEIICGIFAAPRAASDITSDPLMMVHTANVKAKENTVYYLACARSGAQSDTTFQGHSAIAAPSGQIIACSKTNDEEEIIRADLYDEVLIGSRVQIQIFRDRRPELYMPIVEPLSEPYNANTVPEVAAKADPIAESQVNSQAGDISPGRRGSGGCSG